MMDVNLYDKSQHDSNIGQTFSRHFAVTCSSRCILARNAIMFISNTPQASFVS